VLAYIVDNASTNGTWVNGARLAPQSPTPLRHDDLVCFAVSDATAPKCVAFHFKRFDPAVHGKAGAVARGVSSVDSPQAAGVKRPRPNDGGAADPQQALALHKENQALREKAAMLQESLAQHQAKAAADATAAASELAAVREELASKVATAERQVAEAAQQAAEAAEVAAAKLSEAQASGQAEQVRAAAASAAASQAEAAAAEARSERDAALAKLRDCQAALDEARTQLRSHSDGTAAFTADLANRDAALTTARIEKDAALRRAERAESAAQAAEAALASEKALKTTAESSEAALSQRVAALEAKLACEQEKARGTREGVALEHAVLSNLATFVHDIAAMANAALPDAHAIMAMTAVPGIVAGAPVVTKGDSQRGSGMGLCGGTQIMVAPPPPAVLPVEPSTVVPMAEGDTQHVGHQAPTSPVPAAPMVTVEQHNGGDAAATVKPSEPHEAEAAVEALPAAEDMDVAPAADAVQPDVGDIAAGGFGDEENDICAYTVPSASLQAKMEADAAAALVQRNSQESPGPGMQGPWDAGF